MHSHSTDLETFFETRFIEKREKDNRKGTIGTEPFALLGAE
jgi:hypothetical protein